MKSRFTVRWMMFAVAGAALLLSLIAAARGESARGSGAAILGAAVLCLAYTRYSESVALRQAGGVTTSRLQKAVLFMASATIAAAVIGLTDLAFLASYFSFMRIAYEMDVRSHFTPYDDPGYMAMGAAIGLTLALLVASSLRRTVWPREASTNLRLWLKPWPVALTLFLVASLAGESMWQRYRSCRMKAEYHAGPYARAEGPKRAALHAWLRRWYERAAIRPWLPVEPDHIPPGLE